MLGEHAGDGAGNRLYPWPSLTLNMHLSTFESRNDWLLAGREPRPWFAGSFFQVRVPELLTRMLLGTLNIAGQVAVNRLVASAHHRWWRGDSRPNAQPSLVTSKPSRKGASCPICQERFQPKTMVNLGCHDAEHSEAQHLLCTDCFFQTLAFSHVSRCDQCEHYHRQAVALVGRSAPQAQEAGAVPACTSAASRSIPMPVLLVSTWVKAVRCCAENCNGCSPTIWPSDGKMRPR